MRPTRRDFLKLLLSTPIAATLDVEKLLWVPQTQIVVPEMPKVHRWGGVVHFTFDGNGESLRYFELPPGMRLRDALIVPTDKLTPTTEKSLKEGWRG